LIAFKRDCEQATSENTIFVGFGPLAGLPSVVSAISISQRSSNGSMAGASLPADQRSFAIRHSLFLLHHSPLRQCPGNIIAPKMPFLPQNLLTSGRSSKVITHYLA
jgi:hypothetical protein